MRRLHHWLAREWFSCTRQGLSKVGISCSTIYLYSPLPRLVLVAKPRACKKLLFIATHFYCGALPVSPSSRQWPCGFVGVPRQDGRIYSYTICKFDHAAPFDKEIGHGGVGGPPTHLVRGSHTAAQGILDKIPRPIEIRSQLPTSFL